MRILDISRPLGSGAPNWPGDAAFSFRWTSSHSEGAAVSSVTLSPHLATHVDAPLHTTPSAPPAGGIPLATCLGPCRVVDVRGPSRAISAAEIASLPLDGRARVLLKTGSWTDPSCLPHSASGLSGAGVDALADAGVILVGTDSPSIDPLPEEGLEAHLRCAAHRIVILEGLDLTAVDPGDYILVALPLRLTELEASPVRAVLLDEIAP